MHDVSGSRTLILMAGKMNRQDPVETREVQFEQACKRAEVFDYNHLDYIEKGLAPPCPPYTSKNQYSFVGHFVVEA